MIVVDEMSIVETKQLAPRCKQIKVSLDGISYKRISFEHGNKETCVYWMYKGDYISDSKEKILEKIFSEIESN